MARKDNKSRLDFLADMDELACNIASATKRLPNNMLTEKVDAFKALTGYVNTINRTPASEEGNEIDQFRRELGLDSASAVRGGSAGPATGDGDADDTDPEPFDADDDDTGPEPATAEAAPEPSPGVPGTGADPGGEASGSSFSAVRHSVRWDGGTRS